jgi:poly-gamma-glutamate synthesis protein (capsule biosynthesis protein)
LSGNERGVIPGFGRGEADLFLANLEGIPSLLDSEAKPRFDFRFPAERLSFLKGNGLDAVSLANNHALDAGRAGLLGGLKSLQSAGLPSFGAGKDESEACRPWRVERKGVKIAVFGVCLLPGNEAGSDSPGVATLPDHEALLSREFSESRRRGERIVVLVHGGDEYRTEVNEDQRRWARWLAAQGASVVAGAHPHVLQREERHGGATVIHSLGNAVYPVELKGADSGAIRITELP